MGGGGAGGGVWFGTGVVAPVARASRGLAVEGQVRVARALDEQRGRLGSVPDLAHGPDGDVGRRRGGVEPQDHRVSQLADRAAHEWVGRDGAAGDPERRAAVRREARRGWSPWADRVGGRGAPAAAGKNSLRGAGQRRRAARTGGRLVVPGDLGAGEVEKEAGEDEVVRVAKMRLVDEVRGG